MNIVIIAGMELTLSGDAGEIIVPFHTTTDPKEFIIKKISRYRNTKKISSTSLSGLNFSPSYLVNFT